MFNNKLILAPMVRVGCLPFRLTCLDYGADLVYAEEIIAKRLIEATKQKNEILKTVDFLDEDGSVCFRTCDQEHDKVVFQMGVSDPEVAVKAAQIIEPYVAGIDVNMGCPKSYSIKGNMGAALLTRPDLIKSILTSLTSHCTKPVTCKIRILPEDEDTLRLCKLIEETGVAALTVHGRTRYTRSSHPCNYDIIAKIKQHVKIPVILNGASLDIKCRDDMTEVMNKTGVDGIMIARAAWNNPSVFNNPTPVPIKEAVQKYMKYCIDYECGLHTLKYTMAKFKGAFKENEPNFKICRYMESKHIYTYFEVGDYYDKVAANRPITQEMFQQNKRQKLNDNLKVLTCEFTPDIMQSFRSPVAPKQILHQWLIINGFSDPSYFCTEHNRIFTGHLKIDNDTFVVEGNFKNKRTAEQGVAYAYMIKNNIEIRHYKTGPKTNRKKYTEIPENRLPNCVNTPEQCSVELQPVTS